MFVFFVPTGLGDRDLEVRKHMLNAALKAVNDHGKVGVMLSCVLLSARVYLSNRSHFLLVYRRDNPREKLREHEKRAFLVFSQHPKWVITPVNP